jgi:hypothetical protein
MPALGPLAGLDVQERTRPVAEEPLALIARVVTEDRPFTDIVTSPTTVLTATGAAMWSGHDYDPAGPDEQEVRWTDGRPAAGILSANGLWSRHPSNGSNYHRGRANLISRALLCEDFLERDVPISGDVDLSDDEAVADAVKTRPECIACHQSLDPLAGHFWPQVPVVSPGSIALSYLAGCPTLFDQCYPIDTHEPAAALLPPLIGLRSPGYYGADSSDVASLGAHLAEDPRFARCTAKRFYAWFTQTDLLDVPEDVTATLQLRFTEGGFDAKALLRDVVLHPSFLSAADDAADADIRLAGPQIARPWQLEGLVHSLTGFSWQLDVDAFACDVLNLGCYGLVDVLDDDVHGFRAMTGGVDGVRVSRPVHAPTPTKLLAMQVHAEEAAGFVVDADFRVASDERHLLDLVAPDTVDEAAVRAQLVRLHARILVERVAADSPEIDETWALFDAVHRRGGDPAEAWRVVLSTLLRAPSVLFY